MYLHKVLYFIVFLGGANFDTNRGFKQNVRLYFYENIDDTFQRTKPILDYLTQIAGGAGC